MNKRIFTYLILFLTCLGAMQIMSQPVWAVSEITTRPSTPPAPEDAKQRPVQKPCGHCSPFCIQGCRPWIEQNHMDIRKHVTEEFKKHRKWMVETFWKKHILPAMMMMTSQLSTGAIQQVQMVGSFFDAKHQLETQRLFQQLMAQAHKDYMPSEGLCDIATLSRSLASSQRKSNMAHTVLSNRIMDRQLRSGKSLSALERNSDILSRINTFKKYHCNVNDNSKGLSRLCGSGGKKEQINKDVDFTRTIESALTLDIDFTDYDQGTTDITADEIDVFALTLNLIGNTPFPQIDANLLATEDGQPKPEAYRYMDLRSITAKRSVAQNALTAIISERAHGDKEVAPYLKRVIADLGIKEEDVEEILGEKPSYFAQMEVLTKNIYQNPVFYTELYDKPTNVLRKQATLRALNLMQERDIYESQLRSESVLAVMLETMLHTKDQKIKAQLERLQPGGEAAFND